MKCDRCNREHTDFLVEAFPGVNVEQEFDLSWEQSGVRSPAEAREFLHVVFAHLILGKANVKEQMAAARFIVSSICASTDSTLFSVLNGIAADYVHLRVRGN